MYFLVMLVVLLLQVIVVAKMNKRTNYKLIPKKPEERIPGIIMMIVISIAWFVTVPLFLLALAGYIVVKVINWLLERLEK